nr:hypothetical protein [Comamonas thiooxydans]
MKMTSNIQWFSVSKEALPGVLLGMERPSGEPEQSPEAVLNKDCDFSVAMDLSLGLDANVPKAIVIRDKNVSGLLAWLHTYSEETFPISQYCRVLTLSDWVLANAENKKISNINLIHRWSNIICGEILAQSESKINIKSIPLGWAVGCLSYSMARGVSIFSEQPSEIYSLIGSRMLACEDDHSLQKKRLSANFLSKIWFFANESVASNVELAQIIFAIVGSESEDISEYMRLNSALVSTSAEKRIAGFDQVIDYSLRNLVKYNKYNKNNDSFALVLAAASFLAGRGTSHIGLIEPYAKEYPEAYVWFGLFAGMAGPSGWDRDWMKFEKGVEKIVRSSYSLLEAPQADLSWIEYEWLARMHKASDNFSEVLKQNPRALMIEIYPGVPCQFRISSNSVDKISTDEVKFESINKESEKLRDKQLAAAKKIVLELNNLLNSDDEANLKQTDLFPNESRKVTVKKRTSKRIIK